MNHTSFNFSSNDGLTLLGRVWIFPLTQPKGIVYLVHGLGEHSGRCDHVAKALNENGFHFTGFGLLGHGLSEGKRGHTPDYAHLLDDINTFISDSSRQFETNNLTKFTTISAKKK